MKIGMFSPYYGTTTNEHSFFIDQMKQRLQEKGHEVDVISYKFLDVKYNPRWEDFCTRTPISYVFKKFFGAEPSINQILYNLQLEANWPDVKAYDVLWNNGGVWSAFFCGKMKQKFNKPYIHTYHKDTSPLMISIAWTRPNCYVTSNLEQKHYLDRKKLNLWSACIPHGVDVNHFSTDQTMPQITNLPQPVCITAANLHPFKRVPNIIKAVAKTSGSLVVASTGVEKDKILQMGEDLLGDRFLYLGPQPYEKLPAMYNSCDLYINASEKEVYPTHALRAMASGLPVVYHKDDNRMWFIEDGGHCTDCSCPNTLAKAINTANYMEWGPRPYLQAECFSIDQAVNHYEDIMKRIQH